MQREVQPTMIARMLLLFGLLLVVLVSPVAAQDDPVVYAVLFYSPTCPHCHKVINEDLPVMDAEFGDQFQVIPINVSVAAGAQLFYAACDAYDVNDQCGGVPMMLIGETLLFGSLEIPQIAPGIIRDGLETGGIPVGNFPGMQDIFEQWLIVNAEAEEAASPEEATPPVTIINDRSSVWDRIRADPQGNAAAIVVLVALLASVALVIRQGWLNALDAGGWTVKAAIFAAAAVCVLLALSIVARSAGDTLATLIAWGVFFLVSSAIMFLPAAELRLSWGLPLVALAGIGVAVYLAHVEMTDTTATCGAIGDCNTVQQSDYARLLGVLPIGVLGVVGYITILSVWIVTRLPRTNGTYKQAANAILLLLTLFAVVFSTYLTFLEPFVIGATCAWCLMSALTSLLLLWLVAPAGWQALLPFVRQKRVVR